MPGSRIISRAAWGARAARKVSHDFHPESGGVAIHHTGGWPNYIGSHDECYAKVRGIQREHMDTNKWDDIGYSFAACKHGYLFEGRGLGVRPAAQKWGNENYYAILGLVGGRVIPLHPDLYDTITNDLLDAIRFGISYSRSAGNAGGEILGHRNIVSTECPGKLYDYVTSGSLEPGTPPSWPSDDGYDPGGAPAYPGVLLHYPPTMHHSSATTWQRQMQFRGWTISVDGYFGPQSRRVCLAFQQEKGLTVDGVVGPQTWYASWNSPITGGGDSAVDYLNGAPAWPGVLFTYPPYTQHSSVRTWQQRMHDRGWSISVDGVYGSGSRNTCLAFQREKGLAADGIVGPATWQAAWVAPVT